MQNFVAQQKAARDQKKHHGVAKGERQVENRNAGGIFVPNKKTAVT
jgi:hypothetical protein